MNATNASIARCIRDAAYLRNLTAADCARLSGLPLDRVLDLWEKDRADPDVVELLDAALGGTDLFDGLPYAVFHHPDGGEVKLTARFDAIHLACFYVDAINGRPGSSIREMWVAHILRPEVRLHSVGWAV